ncbi:uncharacterized protein LOC110067619 [Orbicella faveolata]|uniref:uncharacterized protein LOC110067619 n=1 Tax=Orbicella faveolata TaxID=48498 RepID=UPI0009E62901|nr:uncharacterized protein LOC110067619 [Orbicella faveolata]XP_020630633.1 uncharacterized protein LOC110067619 [Orbicella faveolata]
MEAAALYSDSSDSEEITLDKESVNRLASAITDTEDTSDGSDEDNRFTRLESTKKRESSPEKHRKDNEVVHGIPMGDPKEDSHSIQSDTQLTREVPTGGATTATTSPRAHTPEEETELFSTDYVDKLVASFWTKVDQKIEQAVSHYQASPQAGQQSNTHDNAHSQEAEREDENNGEKCSLTEYPGGICVFIVFIFQFIGRICVLCKEKIKSKGKEWFTNEKLRTIITHRHANFTVVMVSLVDCFLVVANIFADFDVIDDKGIEFVFTSFLYINLVIMFLFVLECFLRIVVLRKDLFQEKMEIFDVALVYFYFLVELISSNGFSEINKPYPRYLHMIVILRCWRVLLVLQQLEQEKEAEISAMESQPPR